MTLAAHGWGGGYVAAAPTPFTRSGDLDLQRLRDVVAHFVHETAAGVSINGTAGEWFLQSTEERLRVADAAREAVPAEVPFIVGVSSRSSHETARLAEHAQSLGVVAVLLGLPLGRAWSDEEVLGFYRASVRRTGAPTIVYSLRQANGEFLSTELIGQLAALDGIVGVKDDSPDLNRRKTLVLGDHGLTVFADVLHPEMIHAVDAASSSQIGAGMPLGRPLAEALRAPATPQSSRTAEALAYLKRQLHSLYGPGQPWHRDLKGLMFAEGIDAGYPRFPGLSGRDDPILLDRYRDILDRAKRVMSHE